MHYLWMSNEFAERSPDSTSNPDFLSRETDGCEISLARLTMCWQSHEAVI